MAVPGANQLQHPWSHWGPLARTPAGAGRMTTVIPPFRARASRGTVLGLFGGWKPRTFCLALYLLYAVANKYPASITKATWT